MIELMIGVVLVAVLLGIGLPLFRSFILEQRLRATSSDLRVALTMARSEAVKRNREVTLEKSATGWGDGWTIPSPTGGPDILNHVRAGDVTITGPDDVTFTPAGRAKVPPGLAQLQIDVGDDAEEEVRYACLERQLDGRVLSCRQACPDPDAPLPDPCDDGDDA